MADYQAILIRRYQSVWEKNEQYEVDKKKAEEWVSKLATRVTDIVWDFLNSISDDVFGDILLREEKDKDDNKRYLEFHVLATAINSYCNLHNALECVGREVSSFFGYNPMHRIKCYANVKKGQWWNNSFIIPEICKKLGGIKEKSDFGYIDYEEPGYFIKIRFNEKYYHDLYSEE